MRVKFEIAESHIPVWNNQDWRYAILMGGRGNARSGTASRYCVSSLLSKDYTRGAIMRSVSSDIRASCWGEIMDRLTEQGIKDNFRIVDNDMYIERGQNSLRAHGFKASSGSLTARLKSLAGYNLVWIEEGEETGEEEFRTLDDTLRTVKGRIRIIITLNTPPKNHWIIKKWFDLKPHPDVKGFYIPILKPEIKDTLFIGGTWRENKPNMDEHTIDRYMSYKNTNPAYYWQVIEGLSPDEVRGKIFNGWQQCDEIPENATLERIGVDWGWHPDPMVAVAVYYYNGALYVDEIEYDTNIDDEQLASRIKEVPNWRLTQAVCGADEPKSVEALKKYGIRAKCTDNRKGSVQYRIKLTSTKKVFVTRRSTKVWNSYENYRWAEDKDGNPTGDPDHKDSDGMDAVTYAIADINPMLEYMQKQLPQSPRVRSNVGL